MTDSFEDDLVTAIQLPDLRDAFVDLAEAGIDQLVSDGILRDVPLIGTLLRIRTTLGRVRDHLFTKKVAHFFVETSRIPQEDRERFMNEIESRGDRRRLGDTLVLLLDRLDDLEKPVLLARLFAGYVCGVYNYETFRRLSTALDRIELSWLPSLHTFYSSEQHGITTGGQDLSALALSGLVEFRFLPSDSFVGGAFARTELGHHFLKAISRSSSTEHPSRSSSEQVSWT